MSDSRVRSAFSGRTAWARSLQAPLRDFLATETGSASVLLAAALAALAWANIDLSSYESVWRTKLSIQVGDSGISQDLREWVNSGLMTFFFFVVGLEVRREFDVGELRERRRLALPVLAALGGMVVPVAIYLAINGGERRGARLGGGDVDRHRLRARHAGPGRAALPRPPARLHADDHRRRRRRRAAGHRRRLQQRRRPRAAADRGRGLRPDPASPSRCGSARASSTSCSPRSPGWRCSSRASTRSCSASPSA